MSQIVINSEDLRAIASCIDADQLEIETTLRAILADPMAILARVLEYAVRDVTSDEFKAELDRRKAAEQRVMTQEELDHLKERQKFYDRRRESLRQAELAGVDGWEHGGV